MLHSELSINQSKGHTILECLDTVELTVHPSLVPVWENKRLHTNLVDFKSLAEYTIKSNASTLNEAMENIKKYNHTNSLTICIDEAYIYDNPHIVDLFEDFVVKPVSKDSVEYQLVEEYLTKYFNTQDPKVLNEYNEITGLNICTDIFNEFLDPTTGKSLTAQDIKNQYGSFDAYKQQLQLAKDKGSTITNFNAANKTKEQAKTFANAQKRQMQAYQQEQNRKQAKRNAIINSNLKASQAAPSANNGNLVGDIASSVMNAGGANSQGPSWWARNFAAFKNWMNNTFGTKFNTSVGGYNNYKDFAANAAMNFAGTQSAKNLGNQAVNKGKELADKYGGKYANDIKSGIDMIKNVAGGFVQPSNAATEITSGQIISEVYRPRRMYRSSYMRMH